MYERTKYWLEQKQKKLSKQKKLRDTLEKQELKFQPNMDKKDGTRNFMTKRSTVQNIQKIKGVDKHLNRILEAN